MIIKMAKRHPMITLIAFLLLLYLIGTGAILGDNVFAQDVDSAFKLQGGVQA